MTDTSRVARYSDVAAALQALPSEQTGLTLDLLARMLDLTDTDISQRTGGQMSRATINAKRTGRSPVLPADLWPLADALETTIDTLLSAPTDAAAWLLEHHADQLNSAANTRRRRGFPCDRHLASGFARHYRSPGTPRLPLTRPPLAVAIARGTET